MSEYKIYQNIVIILLFCFLIIPNINAAIGVGSPFPSNLELKPGESGRFQFEIQSTQEGLVTCTYKLEQEIPLLVVFDEQVIPIEPKEGETVRMQVYATVTAPAETKPGSYSSSFCVSCAPAKQGSPIGTLGSYCGMTFGVDVVDERTRENPYVPPKKEKINTMLLSIIFGVILAIIIVMLIIIRRIKRND